MVSSNTIHVEAIEKWLNDERYDKLRLPEREWTKVTTNDTIPPQINTTDCGVYVCMAIYCLWFDLPLTYTSIDVTTFRKSVGASILRGCLKLPTN